jgi:D-amino-acid dehydrogenase
MEFSGVNTRLDPRRIAAIERSASGFLEGGLQSGRTEDRTGMRPLLPDGLPAIGRLRRYPNVTVATGHSMLGITLAAATGELVTELVATGNVPTGFEAFSPGRFGA